MGFFDSFFGNSQRRDLQDANQRASGALNQGWQEGSQEVRNGTNAREIYDHFNAISVPMWSYKNDWKRVVNFEEMPMANREGSLFVGRKGPYT